METSTEKRASHVKNTPCDMSIPSFVACFVSDRVVAGTWPDTEMGRIVMMNALIKAWDNRNVQH